MTMGYQEAIEANGVEVIEFKMFGSYQGDWVAILKDGRFIHGSYGSCSGCDAFEAEFGWKDEVVVKQDNGKYYRGNCRWSESDEVTEDEANLLNQKHILKLQKFGESYLESAETKEEIIQRFQRKCDGEYPWHDDLEILEWLKSL